MNSLGVSPGERAPGLSEPDRLTAQQRWAVAMRGVSNVALVAAKLGETPGAAPVAPPQPEVTPRDVIDARNRFAQTGLSEPLINENQSDTEEVQAEANLQYLDKLAQQRAESDARKGVDDAFAA